MNLFTRWAKREYSLTKRLLAVLPAGILFVFLIPLMLVRLGPRLDTLLHLPWLSFGIANLVVGGPLILLGAFYGIWSNVMQLSRARGTPLPVMPTQTLLASGPFRQCRNPMSFGTITLYLGVAILVGSPSSLGMVVLLSALLITYLKRVEERELEARFGEAYRIYKASTPFILPRILRRKP
jgi:protein-S-isoprenylcysteine O-methyltransferase Ste14